MTEQSLMPASVADREALSGPADADVVVIHDPDLARRLRRVAQTLGMPPAVLAEQYLAAALAGADQAGV